MNRPYCLLTCTLLAASLTVTLSKSIESIDPQDDFYHQQQNSIQMPSEEAAMENAFIRYLITKEWLSRARAHSELKLDGLDDRQKKRGYWKQCAFNAVSCFGK